MGSLAGEGVCNYSSCPEPGKSPGPARCPGRIGAWASRALEMVGPEWRSHKGSQEDTCPVNEPPPASREPAGQGRRRGGAVLKGDAGRMGPGRGSAHRGQRRASVASF